MRAIPTEGELGERRQGWNVPEESGTHFWPPRVRQTLPSTCEAVQTIPTNSKPPPQQD